MSTALRRYDFSERLADILGESRRDLRVRVTLMITGGLMPPGPARAGVAAGDRRLRRRSADRGDGGAAAGRTRSTPSAAIGRCCRPGWRPATAPPASSSAPAAGRAARRTDAPELADRSPPRPRCRFGEALARLLEHARDAADARALIARELFGVWLSRGFPGRRRAARRLVGRPAAAIAQPALRTARGRHGRPPGSIPTAAAAPIPACSTACSCRSSKLIEIGALTTPSDDERKPLVSTSDRRSPASPVSPSSPAKRRNRRPWE